MLFRSATTAIIPHVNFIQLFEKYHQDKKLVDALKNNTALLNKLSPQISNALQQHEEIILFFGQIKKAKGVDVLLNALATTKSNFKLVIAGKLRFEEWGKYEEIIKKHQLEEKVIPIIRHISDEERDVLFAISKAIVLPYRFIYQSGVLLMAMSFPKVVIASDLSPNSDIVTDGKNGFLFKCKDAKDLSEKIDNLFSSSYSLESILSNAISDIEKKNSPLTIGKQFHELLRIH